MREEQIRSPHLMLHLGHIFSAGVVGGLSDIMYMLFLSDYLTECGNPVPWPSLVETETLLFCVHSTTMATWTGLSRSLWLPGTWPRRPSELGGNVETPRANLIKYQCGMGGPE